MLAALVMAMAPLAHANGQNWNTTYAETERGHKVGKPDAPLQLIAFVSYSCPVCERFERESEAELKLRFIHEGFLALEIRPEIHSPIDLAISLAVRCGPTDRFFNNHAAMYAAHPQFMARAQATSTDQRARWFSGTQAQRMSAVASDLELYKIMEPHGIGFAELNRCLSDTGAAITILSDEAANSRDFGVMGTPSFALNGELLVDVHSWAALQPVLDAAVQ